MSQRDPFEDYRRRREIELIESRFKEKAAAQRRRIEDLLSHEEGDPGNLDQRVTQEMEDFFAESARTAEKMLGDISEEAGGAVPGAPQARPGANGSEPVEADPAPAPEPTPTPALASAPPSPAPDLSPLPPSKPMSPAATPVAPAPVAETPEEDIPQPRSSDRRPAKGPNETIAKPIDLRAILAKIRRVRNVGGPSVEAAPVNPVTPPSPQAEPEPEPRSVPQNAPQSLPRSAPQSVPEPRPEADENGADDWVKHVLPPLEEAAGPASEFLVKEAAGQPRAVEAPEGETLPAPPPPEPEAAEVGQAEPTASSAGVDVAKLYREKIRRSAVDLSMPEAVTPTPPEGPDGGSSPPGVTNVFPSDADEDRDIDDGVDTEEPVGWNIPTRPPPPGAWLVKKQKEEGEAGLSGNAGDTYLLKKLSQEVRRLNRLYVVLLEKKIVTRVEVEGAEAADGKPAAAGPAPAPAADDGEDDAVSVDDYDETRYRPILTSEKDFSLSSLVNDVHRLKLLRQVLLKKGVVHEKELAKVK